MYQYYPDNYSANIDDYSHDDFLLPDLQTLDYLFPDERDIDIRSFSDDYDDREYI